MRLLETFYILGLTHPTCSLSEFENPEQYFYKVDSVGSTRWKRDDGAVKLKKPIVKKPTQLDKTKATSNITKVAPTLNVTSKAVGSLLLGLNDSSDTSEYTAENLGSEMDEYNNSSVPVNKTREIDHHVYYNSTFFYHPEEAMSLWVDMDNKTSRSMPNVTLHTMLSNSYRRAATVNLSFPFPFYGYPMHNVTIATGGFLYLGHPVHSWLAATQYIAPLMSNFDTRADNSSTIKYADNGTAFVIQWENVMMKDKTPDGRFSFQAILKKNGDIVFVYRDIPVPLSQIPDITHPVKVGFSDAYVIDRTAFFIRKKTIYEYHRAELKSEAITNKTAIYFTALATCNLFHDCETCLSKTTDFDCKWCDKAKKCSDGLDRDRQLWIAMDCDTGPKDNKEQCPSLVVTPKNSPSQSVSGNQLIAPFSKTDY